MTRFACKLLFVWGALGVAALTLPGLFAPAAAQAGQGAAGALREAFDVRYHPGTDRQTLDVFAPAAAGQAGEAPAPVVLFVHGGSWMTGDKNFFGEYRALGRHLAHNGLVAVLINYRLSPAVRHPEHVKDVARAFAWTRRHVRCYGGDPERIFLCGHSAGGHLVSLLATDLSYLTDPALKLAGPDRAALCGVMSVSGVYRVPSPDDFKKMMKEIVEIWIGGRAGRVGALVGSALVRAGEAVNPFRLVFGDDRDVQVRASPISHVRKGLPPFLLLYAQAEVPGLAEMAEDFGKALRRAGNVAQVREVPRCTHRTILQGADALEGPAGRALLEFVRHYAGRKAAP
jgi:acetyl esterase/lipase